MKQKTQKEQKAAKTTKAPKATKTAKTAKTTKTAKTAKATKTAKAAKVQNPEKTVFQKRLERHYDELKWLYIELYNNEEMFAELCEKLEEYYEARTQWLKDLDTEREANPTWYKGNDLLGMMLYIDNFAGNLQGVQNKLDYLESCNVNYIHLMPFLDTPKGRSDGGYAVADFRKVREDLGTMEDLAALSEACHKKGMNLCMDFVMNHTSEDHEWAVKAKAGDSEYQSRYFFYDTYDIPAEYEKTVPQVFPTSAPGNFTWFEECKHHVMTTFYPYQWDLNYRNPRVFNEMMYNFLYLANQGMDIIRIDAVPYIWKELGTDCRNLPQVHTIVRLMRMIGEIVCPSVVLLGEVVMEPVKVVPYFGTVEKPECHMLYNVTTMATTWHSVATRDIRLLKKQMDIVNSLPKDYTFLNYLRCHDDVGWGLDYATLAGWGMQEVPHKRYLNDFFTGKSYGSVSRGELYNDDPVTMDARLCGTTASMCGLEAALAAMDEQQINYAVREVLMLHAYMFTQSGIPMLYSGDEVGQINDYTYKEDPDKVVDSRYVHRGAMNWELAENRNDETTSQGAIFQTLKKLEELRMNDHVFDTDAQVWTVDTYDDSILCIIRHKDGEQMCGIFNFNEYDRTAWINEDGDYVDMMTGEDRVMKGVDIPGHSFIWAKRK